MSKKTSKSSNTSNTVENVVAFFASRVEHYAAIAQKHDDLIASNESQDVRADTLASKNARERAQRMSYVATLLATDSSVAQAFVSRDNDALALASRVEKLAIYAQDKVMQILSALSRKVSLSAVTRNNSTIELLRALRDESAMRSKFATASLMNRYNANANVASTQTSSSVQALRALRIIDTDAQTKQHAIIDSEACELLTA